MPCRVSSNVHEWTNDLPAVPAYGPVNPLYLDEQSRDTQRGEKSPWSFTAACRWDVIAGTECRWEPSRPGSSGAGGGADVTRPICDYISQHSLLCNNRQQAVRLGRHTLERIARGHNARVSGAMTTESRARAKERQ